MRTYTYGTWNSPEGAARYFRLFCVQPLCYIAWLCLLLFEGSAMRHLAMWAVAIMLVLGNALVTVLVECIAWRFLGDPRLPSKIELTDDDTLRLYRKSRMYGEIPLAGISCVVADPPGWWGGVSLTIDSPVLGVREIMVGPYLIGFSDFVRRLHAPRFVQGTPTVADSWHIGAVPMVWVIVLAVAFPVQVCVAVVLADSVLAGVILALLALVCAALVASRTVTGIAITNGRFVVTRGWLWQTTCPISGVMSATVWPAERFPERLSITFDRGHIAVSARSMVGYLALVQRMQEITRSSCPGTDPVRETEP